MRGASAHFANACVIQRRFQLDRLRARPPRNVNVPITIHVRLPVMKLCGTS